MNKTIVIEQDNAMRIVGVREYSDFDNAVQSEQAANPGCDTRRYEVDGRTTVSLYLGKARYIYIIKPLTPAEKP